MSELEKIYEDKRAWTFFKGVDENETIGVYRRCTECGKYLSKGDLLMNMDGEIKLQNWLCKIHGVIEPYFDRDC